MRHYSWFLFPLVGLDITDEDIDLDRPMFGDSTVLSRRHIPQIVAKVREVKIGLGMDPRVADISAKDMTSNLEHAGDDPDPPETYQRAKFQSFIAVKRRGKFDPETMFDPGTTEAANLKALEVASLLAIVLLAQNQKFRTCGLVAETQTRAGAVIQFEFEQGYVITHRPGINGPIALQGLDASQMSREQLLQLLNTDQYKNLTQILLRRSAGVDDSLQTAIQRSAVQLSSAIHSSAPSVQLLSAVTALEILLTYREDEKQMGTIYSKMARRLLGLLGQECVSLYKVDEVFKARHAYVHEGDILEVPTISVRAVGLALACLLRYSQAAPKFFHKSAFMTYLDFVAQSDTLPSGWGPGQEQLLGTPLLHTREGVYFKWQKLQFGLGWPLEKKRPRGWLA